MDRLDPPGRRLQEPAEVQHHAIGANANAPEAREGEREGEAPARAPLANNDREPAAAVHEEEEDDDRLMPDDILPPKDPRRMRLTREEREWGRAVKRAIEAKPELDNLSDFMYAQIGLVDQGNVEKALERAHLLQGFRQEYDILDTLPDAQSRLEKWIQRLPGHVLHHFFSEEHGGYVAVIDAARIDTTCVNSLEGTKDFMAGTYYVHHTLCVDMDAIRQGATMFFECGGYQWKAPNYLTLNMARLVCRESIASYPFEVQQIQCYNGGTMINTLISLSRQFLPEHIKKKISVGHRSTGSLRDICMVPSVEVATERVILQMKEALEERYNNIDSFVL